MAGPPPILPGPPGCGGTSAGRFCLECRATEWDEVILATALRDVNEYVAYSVLLVTSEGARIAAVVNFVPVLDREPMMGVAGANVLGLPEYIAPARTQVIAALQLKLGDRGVTPGGAADAAGHAKDKRERRGGRRRNRGCRRERSRLEISEGLSEVRDLRKAVMLAKVMDLIYNDKLEAVLDHRTMSLIALRKAKSRGESWEKAQLAEVIAEPGINVGPAGFADLFV